MAANSILNPWSRVLLEKLNGSQLVKKFPTFYGTRRFIYSLYKCPPPVSIFSQFNPVHASIPLPEDPSSYYPPISTRAFQVAFFPQISPP